jgi:hypothetical protein
MTRQEAIEPQKDIQGAILEKELRGRWSLILGLFLMQVFGFGFPTFALPFVYSGAIEEFGWTRQEAVLLTCFRFYVSAVAALMVGRLNSPWSGGLSGE